MSVPGRTAHTPTHVDSERAGGVRVGIMPVTALEGLTSDAGCLLTAGEREAVSRLKHARRRRESVAGRLVAKWLVLQYAGAVADGHIGDAWPPSPHTVTAGALDAVPPRDIERVEIIRDAGGAPHLASRLAAIADLRISIAHRSGWAVAAVSRSGPIGVDLEMVTPRRPDFYEGCISDRERAWLHAAPAAQTECLATLLWAVKEACFKTGASLVGSVWEIGGIDLDLTTPARQVASSLARGETARLEPLSLNVALDDAALRPRVAYGARDRLMLAVVALAAT